MKRFQVRVIGRNGEVLHDTTKTYKSKSVAALHDRLTSNMMKKYHGMWRVIEIMLPR
jgi:hypothetical protein